MTDSNTHRGYRNHAALAQLHRWFQYYESANSLLANQLDILDTDIKLKSGIGEGTGHVACKASVAAIPREWKNAHFVIGTDINVHAGGTIDRTVQVTYLNVGIKPNGVVRMADLSYAMKLTPTETVLPRFSNIVITQLSEGETGAFREGFAENRMKSLLNYWLALIENPKRDAPFTAEILARGFPLNIESQKIATANDLSAWAAGTRELHVHDVATFRCRETAINRYEVMADLKYHNVVPSVESRSHMKRYQLQVLDNPAERFARILQCDVVAI